MLAGRNVGVVVTERGAGAGGGVGTDTWVGKRVGAAVGSAAEGGLGADVKSSSFV